MDAYTHNSSHRIQRLSSVTLTPIFFSYLFFSFFSFFFFSNFVDIVQRVSICIKYKFVSRLHLTQFCDLTKLSRRNYTKDHISSIKEKETKMNFFRYIRYVNFNKISFYVHIYIKYIIILETRFAHFSKYI